MHQHAFLMVLSARPLGASDAYSAMSDTTQQCLDAALGREWSTVVNMPGTVHGLIELRALTCIEKREEAQTVMGRAIRKVLGQHEAAFDILVDVILMVDGLGEAMHFDV